MRLLSALMNFAASYERPDGRPLMTWNPVRVLKKKNAIGKLKRRMTYIKDAQLPDWFKALDEVRRKKEKPSSEMVCDYLELILFTGLRRSEAASLSWKNIDFAERTLTVEEEETKNSERHILPLTDHLVRLLETRKRLADTINSPWVFPSTADFKKHIAEPKFISDLVVKKCGFGFTIHDLRRTFCTIAEGRDLSYYAIKKLMNHKMSGDVTRGYQVGDVKRLREPMQKITDHLLSKKAKSAKLKLVS